MKQIVTLLFALLLLPLGAARAAGDPAAAATAWLAKLDAGDYAASWSDAGKLFKDRITSEKWSDAAKRARDPLGAVTSRGAPKATTLDKMPGAPDGHYAELSFGTKFAKEADATETVVLVQEGADWKVVGYFIR